MASGSRLLLRLPSGLRQQILSQEPVVQFGITNRIFLSCHLQTRSFASGSRLAKQKQSNVVSPKPIKKSSQLSKPAPTDAPKAPVSPPAPRPPTTAARSSSRAFIDTFDPLNQKTLLYASPNHGSFYAASYLIGGFLLIGGYCYAEMFLKERPGQKTSWYLKAVGGLSTICVVCFGTVFILAPMKLVKSISIVSSSLPTATATQGPRMLQFEVKRALPFLKPDVLETLPSKVAMDRKVPVAVQDLNFHNIPRPDAQAFTEQYFNKRETARSVGVLGALSSFNRSLLRMWPTIKRETRRMFLRDQMAYIEVAGNGRFKLDLQDCYMLDMGRPLHRIVTADDAARPSIARWAGGLFKR